MMAAKPRDFNVGSTGSVLDEMLGIAPTAPTADDGDSDTPAAANPTEPIPQPDTGKDRPYTGKGKPKATRPRRTPAAPKTTSGKTTRPDPDGMRRWSLYIAETAADQFEAAVDDITTALGDVPKHVAVTALIAHAAAGADEVKADLAAERRRQLAAQIEQLGDLH